MKPLVSILIPAFNAQEWIADSIKSALSQSWQRTEIIVVDDGSIDRTLATAQQFGSETVKVVTQENQGAAAARNKALSLSQGEYIQWLDADDLLAPDKIGSQMQVLEQYQDKRALVSCSWGQFMYRPDRARFLKTSLWCDLSPVEFLVRKLGQNIYMQTGTWLVSRELTESAGPWNTRLLGDDDGEYFCRVLLAADAVRFVPEAKVFYRIPGSTRLSYLGRSARKLEAQFLSIQLHIGYLRSLEDSERVRDACLKYLQTWALFFYPDRLDLVQQLEKLAADLGGRLEPPCLPWKYAWLQKLFGWGFAKSTQISYNQWKSAAIRAWDKAMFRLEMRKPGEC